jgi:hypothetical protein|tara:strand:- start:1049 stop:1339 length:291 start_codon:yes stop_codon:yes gene_type:complete
MFKHELDKYKIRKKVTLIDLTTCFVLTGTVVFCLIDYLFIEIFVWQITLGVIGIFIGLINDTELNENKFLRLWIWTPFTFFAAFLYFTTVNFKLLY